jgi:Protein of unknown function (DUF2510)
MRPEQVLPPTPAQPVATAGWYPSQHGEALRWWNGYAWTDHPQPDTTHALSSPRPTAQAPDRPAASKTLLIAGVVYLCVGVLQVLIDLVSIDAATDRVMADDPTLIRLSVEAGATISVFLDFAVFVVAPGALLALIIWRRLTGALWALVAVLALDVLGSFGILVSDREPIEYVAAVLALPAAAGVILGVVRTHAGWRTVGTPLP